MDGRQRRARREGRKRKRKRKREERSGHSKDGLFKERSRNGAAATSC